MSAEHREERLAFPDAPPGTCQNCGKPTTKGARMHPECRTLHQGRKNYRAATLKRAGPLKYCAALGYSKLPCSPYDPVTGDGLQADHRQRLKDNGPGDATQLLCVNHHQQKTITENWKDRAVAQDQRQAQEVQRQGRGGVIWLLLAVNLALLALAWVHRWTWRLTLYVGVEALALTLIWGAVGWRRARQVRAQFLVAKLARYLALPDTSHRHLLHSRWAGDGVPVAGVLRYGPTFNDLDGPDMDRAESIIAAITAQPTSFDWVTGRNELHWWPTHPSDLAADEPDQNTPPPAAGPTPEQKRVETALGDSIAAALATREGERADCKTTVAEWAQDVKDHPVELRIAYPAVAARKVVGAEVDIVDAVSAIEQPTGEWKPTVDRRALLVVVRDRPDPLDQLIPHAPVDPGIDLTVGPVIGLDENLQPHREPAIGKSRLIAGESGSGKASIQWGIIRGLAPFIRGGLVRMWVINPKPEEFASLADSAYRYADRPGDIADVLEEAREHLERDQDWMKANGVRKRTHPTKERPLNWLLHDELAMTTAYVADAKMKRQNSANVAAIVTQSRSAGWGSDFATQDPRSEVVKMRPIFNRQIGLRLPDADATRQILGASARAAGALCDRIRQDRPGTFYVVDDDFKGFKRVRTAYTSDDDVQAISDYLAGRTDTLEGAA